MMSVVNGHVEMCKLLIDNGALASINTPDNVNNQSMYICLDLYA
jgi:hypothetical protein